MSTFSYKVKKNGSETRGIVNGTRDEIRKKFIEDGYILLELEEKTAQEKPVNIKVNDKTQSFMNKKIQLPTNVKSKKIAEFASEFAILIDAGLTVPESIRLMLKNEKEGYFRELLTTFEKDINQGVALSESIKKTKAFPDLFVMLLKTGEFTGEIGVVLKTVAAYYEKIDANRSKIIGASVYPGLLLFFLFVNLIVMSVKVVPMFKVMFAGAEDQLPWNTKLIFKMSEVIKDNLIFIFILFFALIMFLMFKNRVPAFKRAMDIIVLKIPLAKSLVTDTIISSFLKSLSLLVRSGSTMIDAVSLSIETIDNHVIKKSIADESKGIIEGKSLSVLLKDNKYLNNIAKTFIEIGENSAKIDQTLERAAVYYDREIDKKIDLMNRLMEPIMICIMGGVVGFVVVSIAMPMFNMTKLIH